MKKIGSKSKCGSRVGAGGVGGGERKRERKKEKYYLENK